LFKGLKPLKKEILLSFPNSDEAVSKINFFVILSEREELFS
jgi:hypothetical protein